jgi:hypothetical protein
MQQPKEINIQALYKLSVLIHQGGLCFYIYDHNAACVEQIERSFKQVLNPIELLDEIKRLYEEEPLLLQEFASFSLVYHHDLFTIVPEALFQEDKAPDYLKYNTRLLNTDVISVDEPVTTLGARCVYIAYANINNYFHDRYGAFEYNHYASRLLDALHAQSSGASEEVFIDIKDSYCYLTLFKEGKLVLHNIYPQEAPEDILYYTMFATAHNGFDPEIMETIIIQPVKNQAMYDLIFTYVRNLSHVTESGTLIKNILCA